MNFKKYFILTAISFIVLIPIFAFTETIVLKSGDTMDVEKTWEEGDRIFFLIRGLKASVPKKDVEIIKKDKHSPNKAIAKEENKKGNLKTVRSKPKNDARQTAIKQTNRRTASTKQKKNLVKKPAMFREDGFRDLPWGARASSIDGLEQTESDTGLDGVVEFVRPTDTLKIGKTELQSILYSFWQGRLYTVTIWTKGYSNYTSLRDIVFEQFGEGHLSDRSPQKYIWSHQSTDMMLEYIKKNQHGMLWMRSRELDRKYKLSNLKGHSSFVKSRNAAK